MAGLLGKIKTNIAYTRAINVERDGLNEQLAGYILTDNARRLLRVIAEGMQKETAARAWSLVGPYGTGKSAFSLYLAALLSPAATERNRLAQAVCKQVDLALAADFARIADKKGYRPVFLTGSRSPMAQRLLSQMADALKGCRQVGTLRKEIATALKGEVAAPEVIAYIKQGVECVRASGMQGLLIVVDEIGKFLEYDAEHPESDNAYLLQVLGEMTLKSREADGGILFLGVLHQSFDFYARGLGQEARAEWSKVQGRFAQLAFVESSEQMIKLVDRAIIHSFTAKQQRELSDRAAPHSARLYQSGFWGEHLPDPAKAHELLTGCYPLHPVSVALLVLLCEKFGQHERTLLGYLAGEQPHSFPEQLSKLREDGWIQPWTLFDYLFASGYSATMNPLLNRRWVEVQAALERLGGNAPELQIKVLKTIALFNLIGARGQFVASNTLLKSAFLSEDIEAAITALQQQSLMVYRRFTDEYRIWQGSDFDLDAAIEQKTEIGFRLPEALNTKNPLPPLIARKHTIETGNTRQLPYVFLDADTSMTELDQCIGPHFAVYLANSGEKTPPQAVQERFATDSLLTVSRGSKRLADTIREKQALEAVMAMPELANDPIALAEARERYKHLIRTERRLLNTLISPIGGREIYRQGELRAVETRRGLQEEASRLMDTVFSKAPHLANELVNRGKLSTQAAQARNRLLQALLVREAEADLGMSKDTYPPEKGLYLSLLKASGLHRCADGAWKLHPPSKMESKANLYPVWQRIEDFLDDANAPRALSALDAELLAAPYGIKRGLLTILYALVILANKDTVAIYEDGSYIPFFEDHHLERFLVRPTTFAFRKLSLTGLTACALEAYQEVLGGNKQQILSIVRPLVRKISQLPTYTKNTPLAGEQAQKLMQAVAGASSPQDLLFEDMPCALGFEPEALATAEGHKEFVSALTATLNRLETLFADMLDGFQKLIARGIGQDTDLSLAETRRALAKRVSGLERYTDAEDLGAFIRQVRGKAVIDDIWLGQLMLNLSGKNPQQWTEQDRGFAEAKLAEYCFRIEGLEACRTMEHGVSKGVKWLKPCDKALQGYLTDLHPQQRLSVLVAALEREFMNREAILADVPASAGQKK